MLKKTKVKLELFTDVDMYNFIEKGLRGGLSLCINRQGCANNKYMNTYDVNKPTKFITYLDINNLYGWAMVQSLPYKDFKFIDPEIYVLPDYKTLCSNKLKKGHILEIDLKYPKKLHDLHNEFSYF